MIYVWTYVSTLKVPLYANTIYHQINHKNHSSLSLCLYPRVMVARVLLLNNKLIVKIYIRFRPLYVLYISCRSEKYVHVTYVTSIDRNRKQSLKFYLNDSIWVGSLRRSRALTHTVQVLVQRGSLSCFHIRQKFWCRKKCNYGAVIFELVEM